MSIKKTIKLIILWFARILGLFSLSGWLTRNSITIIGWHGVSMEDEHLRFGSLFISPETFRKRLEFIRKTYTVISLEEAIRQHGNGRIKPRQIVLTFDDGYYNFYAVAAPILEEFGMTATVYLVSENLTTDKPYFPLIVRDTVLSTKQSSVLISMLGMDGEYALETEIDKATLATQALSYLHSLTLNSDAQLNFCKQFARELNIDFDDLMKRRIWRSMTPNEAKELTKKGFSMQLHSHEHKNATRILESLEEDTRQCRTLIEAATATKAVDYCYPAGFWSKQTWDPLRNAGVRSATTVRSGPNFVKTPPLALRRNLDGEDRTQIEFESGLCNILWLFHLLFHPGRLHEPSEKFKAYAEDKVLY